MRHLIALGVGLLVLVCVVLLVRFFMLALLACALLCGAYILGRVILDVVHIIRMKSF